MGIFSRWWVIGIVLLGLIGQQARSQDSPLAQYYGFKPVEVFKLSDQRVANMQTGDLNHDGLTDVVLIDNHHSRIELLLQRKDPAATKSKEKSDVNFVEDNSRFEHKKIPVDHQIAALTLGDFNGDGRTDIVYFGMPDHLVFRFQPEKGDWTEKKQQRIPDASPRQWFLTTGDLDGNGLDDLVILGKHETILLHQSSKGVFAAPKKLMNTSDKLGLAQVADLDGDGRQDVCYLAGEEDNQVLGARLQQQSGQLGPEYVFDLERPAAVTLKNIDGKPGSEILTIDKQTRRLKLLNVELKQLGKGELPERLVQYGFGKQGSGRERDIALGDFNGDGLSDVIVSDPEASRILYFQQNRGHGLDMGTPYPSLTGTDRIRAADLDGDGKVELVVHSSKEKTLGVSRFEEGRMTFPQSIPTEGDAVMIELADIDADGHPEVLYIVKTKKDRSSEYTLQAMKRVQKDEWQPFQFGGKNGASLELKGTPERIVFMDLLANGRPEFMVFLESKAPQLFSFDEKGVPTEVATAGLGPGSVTSAAASRSTLSGKNGLLVSQDNFARQMVLSPQKRWEVVDQFNVAESNTKLQAGTEIDLNGDGELEIALIDSGLHKLRLMRKQDGTYQPWKEIDIGEFPLKSLKVADFNGDKKDDLLLFGSDKFALLFASGSSPAIKELAAFESQLEKVFPNDVVAGDLNGDGFVDLAMTDTRNQYVEIIQYRQTTGLQHALYFRIFEHKSFRNDNETKESDPREALIADVTGDGLPDLILLTHDRLLVYPQDNGE